MGSGGGVVGPELSEQDTSFYCEVQPTTGDIDMDKNPAYQALKMDEHNYI